MPKKMTPEGEKTLLAILYWAHRDYKPSAADLNRWTKIFGPFTPKVWEEISERAYLPTRGEAADIWREQAELRRQEEERAQAEHITQRWTNSHSKSWSKVWESWGSEDDS